MTGYVYDAEGYRVAKGTITSMSCDPSVNGIATANNETDYVLGPGGEQVTELAQDANGTMNWQRTYVYAVGLIATYDPNPDNPSQPLPSFRLTDWLGTLRATTDAYGVAQGTCTGLPYGDGVTCSGDIPDNHHFTGKERDAETGNDYFGARYFASSMGRFMSPDWSAQEEPVPYAKLGDPQSLNLYSYVRNNPLGGVDQDGHCAGDPVVCRRICQDKPCFQAASGSAPPSLPAQQQIGQDPTLPTEVQPPPPSLADKVGEALLPKTPLDLALLVIPDIGELGEAGAALSRVLELSSTMGKTADYVTLAVTETKEGTSVVSSSEEALRPAVRALLKPGEVAANGAGHAEVTGVNTARQMGLTPTGVAASRGICPSCADFLRTAGVAALSALKATLPF
jgi:RHS repeat-associated protein